jgi:hypothetical protein
MKLNCKYLFKIRLLHLHLKTSGFCLNSRCSESHNVLLLKLFTVFYVLYFSINSDHKCNFLLFLYILLYLSTRCTKWMNSGDSCKRPSVCLHVSHRTHCTDFDDFLLEALH